MATKQVEKGSILTATETLNCFNGGSRITKGRQYEVIKVVGENDQIDGDIERPAVVVRPRGIKLGSYPYAIKLSRFKNG